MYTHGRSINEILQCGQHIIRDLTFQYVISDFKAQNILPSPLKTDKMKKKKKKSSSKKWHGSARAYSEKFKCFL